MSITCGSITLSPIANVFASGVTSGEYYDYGQFVMCPSIGAVDYDEELVHMKGISGTATKRGQFFSRNIMIPFIFVQAYSSMYSRINTVINALQVNARYAVTIEGQAFSGCKLMQGGIGQAQEKEFHNFTAIIVPITFTQLSLEN